MTRRQRRLDGLAAPARGTSVSPPPPSGPEEGSTSGEPPPPGPRSPTRSTPSKPAGAPRAGGKHRRAVSLPTPLATQLRQRAQELDRFQTDLVLECLAALASTAHSDQGKEHSSGVGPFDRPQRRAHRGRTVTTLTLYLIQGEVDAIDDLARTTGHTRSGLVAAALESHLVEIS